MVEIYLNGEAKQVVAHLTLGQLIELLALPPQAMAVAVNRNVVPRKQWDGVFVKHGDQIDIVRAIGGG
jgi:sulfur carrier protein